MSQREKNSNTGTHVSELWCAAREAPMGKREAGTEAPAGSGEQAPWERGAGVCCLLGGGDLRGLREELTEESEFGGPGRASVGTQIADGGPGGSPVDTERRCSRRLTRLAARDILDRVRLVTDRLWVPRSWGLARRCHLPVQALLSSPIYLTLGHPSSVLGSHLSLGATACGLCGPSTEVTWG